MAEEGGYWDTGDWNRDTGHRMLGTWYRILATGRVTSGMMSHMLDTQLNLGAFLFGSWGEGACADTHHS